MTIDHGSSFGVLTVYHINGVVTHACKVCKTNTTLVFYKSFAAQARWPF